jgi:farnesyl diphosphate synthase
MTIATKTTEFIEAFESKIYPDLIEELKTFNLPQDGIIYCQTMLKETILGGKMNRGLTVASALSSIVGKELTTAQQFDAHCLGWCIEMLQAFFLIQDDIMDSSITRRGAPCWYRRVISI